MYYVYILLLKSNNLYAGYSADLKTRINYHLSGKVKSTKGKVIKLLHYEAYLLETDAIRREKFLKTTEGKRLLRQQIRDTLSKELVSL